MATSTKPNANKTTTKKTKTLSEILGVSDDASDDPIQLINNMCIEFGRRMVLPLVKATIKVEDNIDAGRGRFQALERKENDIIFRVIMRLRRKHNLGMSTSMLRNELMETVLQIIDICDDNGIELK